MTSSRNVVASCGLGNGFFTTGNYYLSGSLIGNTGGDFTISNPNSFIFLSPAYSVRTGGMALHMESANNQTFTGSVTGDQTIRSDSNLWLGTDIAGKRLNLASPSGCYANGARLDGKGFAYYYGSATFNAGSRYGYIPPTFGASSGTTLTYNGANGRFTNSTVFTVLVTAFYSCLKDTGVGSNACVYIIELNETPADSTDCAQSRVSEVEWATGSASFILAPTQYFKVVGIATGVGVGNSNFNSASKVGYTLRTL